MIFISQIVELSKSGFTTLIYLFSLLIVTATLSGCDRSMTPEEKAERARKDAAQALADAASPESMWYRFTFKVDYEGKPIKFDQMVYCPRRSFSGGRYGQVPSYSIRQQHPMTIAKKMDDGSQVLVRIPDMCKRYRNYKLGEGFQNGWISEGPFETMPYVIWSNSYPRPDRIEGYVSPSYYNHPDARLKNPNGQVHLLPVGSYPKNYADILKQEHAIPYSPDPWINPDVPNANWSSRSGYYHDTEDQFLSFYQIPIVDMNAYVEKYKDTAKMQGKPKPYSLETEFSDSNFAAYNVASSSPIPDFAINDLNYISYGCVSRAMSSNLAGVPMKTNMPLDPEDIGSEIAVTARIKGSPDSNDPKVAALLEFEKQKQANCQDRLAQLKSYEIVNGRFNAAGAMPGVAVYRRWGGTKESLKKAGLVTDQGYKMTVDGHDFTYEVVVYGETISPLMLLENKNTGQWYMLRNLKFFFTGEGENNRF